MEKKDWFEQRSQIEKEVLYKSELEHYSEKMVLNTENRIIFINAKYAAEFGKRPEELEGVLFDEFMAEAKDKVPPILEISDFASPYIPYAERLQNDGRPRVFLRAPLISEDNVVLGHMIYDGRDWLQRYRSLFLKLNEMEDEYQYLNQNQNREANAQFVGSSPVITQLKHEILQIAQINATLLIEGETGTGKEVVANHVYQASKRHGKPFVKLNCAAVPYELMESELFGYEEGAFTGARKGGKKGLFEQANGGTILLDEINSLNLSAQAKLLRVLQEHVVTKVGGGKQIPIDVRVIAISNRPLQEMVEEGTFREDLYYRLNVLHIQVPPLRKRLEDIPELVHLFVEKCNKEMDKHVDTIDPQIYVLLKKQNWPGNVRQLQNWKLFRGRENDVVTLNVQRDDQKFSDALTEGNFSGSGERVASQSASIQYDSQQDTYVVIQDQLGNQIDEGKLRQYTEAYVGQSLDASFFKNNLQIEVNENLYKAAEVTADSTELNEKAAELNTLLSNYRNASITYTFGSVTEVLNGETTGAWLQISDDGITVDEAQVQFYVENLAGKYNTIYVPRSFQTTGGGVIEVSNNEYGYRIDQSGEVQQILTDLKSGEAVTREPVYEKAGLSRNGTDDLNGSYIEVSLSQQHLWLYKDGALVTETDVISGLPTPERATYTGAYPIAYKASPFTLSSEEYGYETTVQYWMPFVYGQGLHDASWQSSFGGDAYKTRGSHGCVNLPPDEASIIYNTIEGGYPIILY